MSFKIFISEETKLSPTIIFSSPEEIDSLIRDLKRGDYVQVFSFCNPHGEAEFQIYRL